MRRWDVAKLEPVVAAPHSPDNRKLARECSDVKIDRVYIGSCTGKGVRRSMVRAQGWRPAHCRAPHMCCQQHVLPGIA